MSGGTCGCATQPCGCCDGVAQLTPAAIHNRPGLDALSYRVGTHAQFFETMQARLSTIRVDGVGPDGQTAQTWRPLQGLTTRDRGDLSIALLDGWATVADVLTFYQERIANEGFLRTATERRSVLELARLVGYALRPGVAATAYLAYTIDEHQVALATIAAGTRSQSMPGPGESPQSFETSEDLVARGAWNNLQVRQHRPQNITLDTTLSIADKDLTVDTVLAALRVNRYALAIDTIMVAGTATSLKAGDKLLLTFSDDGASSVVRSVAGVDTVFADQRTALALQPIDRTVVASAALLANCIAQLKDVQKDEKPDGGKDVVSGVIDILQGVLVQVYLGLPSALPRDPKQRSQLIEPAGTLSGNPKKLVDRLSSQIHAILNNGKLPETSVTSPGAFLKDLLTPAVPQVASSLHLSRNLAASFAAGADGTARADGSPQLLVQFAPVLRDTFYRAWSGATVNATAAPLRSVYALRARTTLFGAGASRIPTYFGTNDHGHINGELKPQSEWHEWHYAQDEVDNNAFLDQANEAITPGSYVLAHVSTIARPTSVPRVSPAVSSRHVTQVAEVSVSPRSEYGLSGPSTELVFSGDVPWRITGKPSKTAMVDNEARSTKGKITALRQTQIYAQSEPLTLVDEPITDPVDGPQIELGGLYSELTSGRWVILSGERADIPNVSGVRAAELMMISGLSHGFDPKLPGDQTHTTLILATPPAYHYKRATLTIYGNVVKATNGETRNEILGSGDGAQPLQSFTLKQPPLTFVAAPTAAGAESTLHVYVNNVEWHEVDSLAGLGPQDHRFVTATDDAGNTQLTFGNGVQAARLPTGVQNVNSVYRNGIGAGGNVKPEQISLLLSRPLGVMSVINPLRASGGADKESRDLARDNVPLSVMPLDRLVSVADYADFTRSFAGIAKAIAHQVSDGRRQLIQLTIAGVDDIPIDPSSDLYRNLLAAFRKLGDQDLPVQVDLRELIALVLSAGVKLLPDYLWEPVVTTIRARLLDAFGFGKRALGQPAQRCEVMSAMQGVPGVAYVSIGAFGGVPEKKDEAGARVLLGPDAIASAVAKIVTSAKGSRTGERVDAFPGGIDQGAIRPAQLAILTPAVADTLILNQLP